MEQGGVSSLSRILDEDSSKIVFVTYKVEIKGSLIKHFWIHVPDLCLIVSYGGASMAK